MPGLAGQSWLDSQENYAQGYTINIKGTTATAAHLSEDVTIPCALYAVTLALNPSVGSGEVTLKNGKGTATAGSNVWTAEIASAASQTYVLHATFPRGMIFSSGLIVSAATITGSVSLLFKQRYDS